MKKIYRLLFVFIACCSFNVSAQLDPLYNQYFFNQAMINPA
ncbi:hypothetical protein SAMN05661096_04024, partial [Marivirga sericea]